MQQPERAHLVRVRARVRVRLGLRVRLRVRDRVRVRWQPERAHVLALDQRPQHHPAR